jgi:hypothetical protein
MITFAHNSRTENEPAVNRSSAGHNMVLPNPPKSPSMILALSGCNTLGTKNATKCPFPQARVQNSAANTINTVEHRSNKNSKTMIKKGSTSINITKPRRVTDKLSWLQQAKSIIIISLKCGQSSDDAQLILSLQAKHEVPRLSNPRVRWNISASKFVLTIYLNHKLN